MSKKVVQVSPEAAEKDAQFVAERKRKGTERYIKRHSLQARLTHGITVISCIWLCISGLFVFVPPLTQLAGSDVVFRIPYVASRFRGGFCSGSSHQCY